MFKIIVLLTLIIPLNNSMAEGTNAICKDNPNGIVKDYYSNNKLQTEWHGR